MLCSYLPFSKCDLMAPALTRFIIIRGIISSGSISVIGSSSSSSSIIIINITTTIINSYYDY